MKDSGKHDASEKRANRELLTKPLLHVFVTFLMAVAKTPVQNHVRKGLFWLHVRKSAMLRTARHRSTRLLVTVHLQTGSGE